jgi:hypothetical protein
MVLQYTKLPLKNWLQHPDQNRYDTVGFFPSLTPTPEQLSPKVFNVFTGMGIERADAVPGDCTALVDHITTILCDGNTEHADYLLNCMAQMVQTPWKKLYVALVFVSDEGAGKSLVWNRFMGAILGNNLMAQANHQAILGNFNDSLSGKLLVVAEELCWNGMQGSGILKDLLSSDVLFREQLAEHDVGDMNTAPGFMNRKHQQSWTEPNMLNLVICTNGAQGGLRGGGRSSRRAGCSVSSCGDCGGGTGAGGGCGGKGVCQRAGGGVAGADRRPVRPNRGPCHGGELQRCLRVAAGKRQLRLRCCWQFQLSFRQQDC